MSSSPTVIDISRMPAPSILEVLSHADMLAAFVTRFKEFWAEARAKDPTLPDYDVQMLETDPAIIVGQAWTYLRLLDRARVNDAVRAVLAPTAKGADLDAVVARVNIERLVLVPANPATGAPAVMESDERLLYRYLLAFDRPSAGSADRYLFEAYTAVPSLHDAAVVGRAVHGRRGDTDIVIAGPDGRLPTSEEIAAVNAAVNAPNVTPEAVAVTVVPAIRATYTLSLRVFIGSGPDAGLVLQEVEKRVKDVTDERMVINGEVPPELPSGACYGPNVIRAEWNEPFAGIPSHPYTIPVCTGIEIIGEALA
jgi:phage-related baseplate assembly protein